MLTLAASPVAFVLLVIVLAGVAAGRHPGLRLRAAAVPAVAVAAATAAELLTLHLFPVGTLAFPAAEAVQAAAFCIGLLALTWRLERARGLRGVLAVYLVAVVAIYVIPTGLGHDIARLRLLALPLALLVAALRRWRPLPLVLAAVGLAAAWNVVPPGERLGEQHGRPLCERRECGPLPCPICGRTCARATAWRRWTRSTTGRRSISPGRTFRSCAAGSGRTTIPWPDSSTTASPQPSTSAGCAASASSTSS